MGILRIVSTLLLLFLAVYSVLTAVGAFAGITIYFPFHISNADSIPYHRWQSVRVAVLLAFAYFTLLHIFRGKKALYPIKFLEIIAKKINKFSGTLLTFDYGYEAKKNQNSLQSVKKHKFVETYFAPGLSDITSHINFRLFKEILEKNNLHVEKITNQNEFLKKMGILERANILSKKMTFKEKANMFYRLKRLLDPKDMGDLFKVVFAQKKNKNFSLGF